MTTSTPSTALDLSPSATTIQALVASWSEKHPEMRTRIYRAVALVSNVTPASATVFYVEGSEGKRYMVKVNRRERTSTCTCEDHVFRGVKCKHVLAAGLFEQGRLRECC